MSNDYRQQQHDDDQRGLQGSVESMTEVDDGVELTVRLRNPLDRAIHYISDVRGMLFDPATQHLRVQLSDRGREMPPGGIAMEPRFRLIDPQSEALVRVRLPKSIVKLADVPSPTGEVVFEEHVITDADEIELEIGWADTPYYTDPRDKARGASPISSWEQESLRVTFTPPKEKGSDRQPK
jgi:hypothetical protein